MLNIIYICAIVLFLCVSSSKILYKFGVPTLLIFLGLGMLLGSEGIGNIYFNNPAIARDICTFCLVIIMFFGGFGINLKVAKPVLVPSILLSSLGVLITATLVGIFSYWLLKISFLESLLIGAVISSTDFASVFSILRSKKLNLKGGLASLLEIESGSNDPFSYILTIIVLSIIKATSHTIVSDTLKLLFFQLFFGILIGLCIGFATTYIVKKIDLEIDGLYPILLISFVLFSYALAEKLGGNGLLSVYITGVFIGNNKLVHKKSLVHFFDGVSWLMQIIIFFTLGLLVFPSQLLNVFSSSLSISIFMLLVARPIAVFSILSWFKIPVKAQLFVSWVGLRGVASIVFATIALADGLPIANQIFNTVFFIAIISVGVQGTFLPQIAKKLDLVEEQGSVFKIFNDYEDEIDKRLVEFKVAEASILANKKIMEAQIPDDVFIIMIKRKGEIIMPKGLTTILPGDILVLSETALYQMEAY